MVKFISARCAPRTHWTGRCVESIMSGRSGWDKKSCFLGSWSTNSWSSRTWSSHYSEWVIQVSNTIGMELNRDIRIWVFPFYENFPNWFLLIRFPVKTVCFSPFAFKIFLDVVVIVYGDKCNLRSRVRRSFPQRPFTFLPFGQNIFLALRFIYPKQIFFLLCKKKFRTNRNT